MTVTMTDMVSRKQKNTAQADDPHPPFKRYTLTAASGAVV
jgi:hypothetical protein